jgi:hypothetical protein
VSETIDIEHGSTAVHCSLDSHVFTIWNEDRLSVGRLTFEVEQLDDLIFVLDCLKAGIDDYRRDETASSYRINLNSTNWLKAITEGGCFGTDD